MWVEMCQSQSQSQSLTSFCSCYSFLTIFHSLNDLLLVILPLSPPPQNIVGSINVAVISFNKCRKKSTRCINQRVAIFFFAFFLKVWYLKHFWQEGFQGGGSVSKSLKLTLNGVDGKGGCPQMYVWEGARMRWINEWVSGGGAKKEMWGWKKKSEWEVVGIDDMLQFFSIKRELRPLNSSLFFLVLTLLNSLPILFFSFPPQLTINISNHFYHHAIAPKGNNLKTQK